MPDLTVKQKAFCRLMASGRCGNQSDAYRKAFKSNAMPTTIKVRASELMAKRNIQVTIKELSAPIDARIRKSREDLLDLLEDITYHDIGKMYDPFGNPVEPYLLERGERMAIVGFEFTEDFIGVRGRSKKKDGDDSDDTTQMAAGYTKKYKHVDRHKYLITYAKMLGYISDDPPETDESLKSLTVAFVNSKGERVDLETIEHTRPTRVIEPQPDGPGFKLVR